MEQRLNKFPLGFTLADMMVATAIVVTLSIIMVVNFKAGRERDDLRNAGLFIVSLLHQAQSYTLAGKTCLDSGGGVVSPSGYGVLIDARNEVIYFYGDDNTGIFEGSEPCIEEHYLSSYNIELDETTVCVDLGWGCEAGRESIDYIYTKPYANRILGGSATPNQGNFSVVIRHSTGLAGQGILLSSDAVTGQAVLGLIANQ